MKTCKLLLLALCCGCISASAAGKAGSEAPRIVNIVNFIRNIEPRSEEITETVLYETVARQAAQLAEYGLPATFLLQYDALINPRYRKLLTQDVYPGTEVGGWWEITQPHVEAAGLKWRGFATGYTPEERRKLVDVYMEKFKEIFGKYPTAIGSWFIDAYTLGYMYDKYGIVASCNCKDQIGTDGYTLWGGYWNQAYYPSRVNAYMPAQTREGQIPVPVFRMLGSDPIYQYDNCVGGALQGVISLEPVYGDSGGSRTLPRIRLHPGRAGKLLHLGQYREGAQHPDPAAGKPFPQGRNPCGDAHPVGRMVPGEFPGNAPDGRHGTDRLP